MYNFAAIEIQRDKRNLVTEYGYIDKKILFFFNKDIDKRKKIKYVFAVNKDFN